MGGKEAGFQKFGREGEHRGRAAEFAAKSGPKEGKAREKSQGLQTRGGPPAPEAHAVPFS